MLKPPSASVTLLGSWDGGRPAVARAGGGPGGGGPRAGRGAPGKGAGAAILGLIALAVVMTVVSAGLVFIQPEERGVVISALDPKGYRTEALQPGLRWVVPFLENVVTYPISRQTYTMSIAPLEGAVQGGDAV